MGHRRRGSLSVACFLGLILALALTGSSCSGGGGSDSGGSDCTSSNAAKLTGTLQVKNSSFNPSCFAVASGTTISVANSDPLGHTFTVKGTDIDVPLPRSGTGEATAPAPGTYDFYCTIHPGMTGTIVVT